ncbi:unnamed protein product [Parajaminaea phylloscopi]
MDPQVPAGAAAAPPPADTSEGPTSPMSTSTHSQSSPRLFQPIPLPASILRSSSFHPASRPSTPDASSIHFSSGTHPEHTPTTPDAISAHMIDPMQSVHPASRPSSLRRASDDALALPRSPDRSPSSISISPSYPRSIGEASTSSLADDAASSSSHPHHHGILKHKRQSNYGGRLGGPSIPPKSRTSSSGSFGADLKPGYERRVGFDSMIDADETASGTFGFTLQVKSHGYQRTRNTRTFMCAVDENPYSERALEWLMESLVEDNDELVTVSVLEGDPDEIDQEQAREAAKELMSAILVLNEEVKDRKISIVVEFVAGRVTSTIVRLIHMYRPDSLTIGTRGRSVNALQKLMGGAMIGGSSRDILLRSPVPVVVVRPENKVAKHLRERQADPKRRSYHALVGDGDLPLTKPKDKPRKGKDAQKDSSHTASKDASSLKSFNSGGLFRTSHSRDDVSET